MKAYLALCLLFCCLQVHSRGIDYHNYTQIEKILKIFSLRFPKLTTLKVIGKSHDARNIYAMRITSNPQEDLPEALYIAGMHGCEPVGIEIPIRFMAYLLESYDKSEHIRSFLSNRHLWFVPLVNPDGLTRFYSGFLYWKKNLNSNGSSNVFLQGVDINRNFSYEWGADSYGSSGSRFPQDYRGKGPFSEPETQAVRNFVMQHRFKVSFSFHTFGEQFLYPWSYTKYLPTDDELFFRLYASHLAKKNGYSFGNPLSGEIHLSNGDFDDWMYGEVNSKKIRTYPLTVELGEFIIYPNIDLLPHFKKTIYANLFMAFIADNPKYNVYNRTSKIEKKVQNIIKQVSSLYKNEGEWVIDFFRRGGKYYELLRRD